MRDETPAMGILKKGDWGDAQSYRIECSCGQDWHSHDLWVEHDGSEVSVNVEITMKSDYWTETIEPSYAINNEWLQELHWWAVGLANGFVRRLRGTYQLWVYGTVEQSTVITMSPQQALNYAETLTRAVSEVVQAREQAQ